MRNNVGIEFLEFLDTSTKEIENGLELGFLGIFECL